MFFTWKTNTWLLWENWDIVKQNVLIGGGRSNATPSTGTNVSGSTAVLVSDLASVSTGLTHEFAHVFRSVRSITTSTTTLVDNNSSRKAGERVPRFV